MAFKIFRKYVGRNSKHDFCKVWNYVTKKLVI